MGIVSADFGGRRARRQITRWTIVVLLALIALWWAPGLLYFYTEWLWFRFDVGFPKLFWTIFGTRVGLGVVFGATFLVLVLGNVEVARRMARRTIWYDEERELRQRIAEAMEYFASHYLYLALVAFAVVVAYGVGKDAAGQWSNYLLFRQGEAFGVEDPIFGRDVGFYIFRLPFWRYLQQYAYLVLLAVFVVSAAAHYLDKAIRVLRGVPAFAPHVKTHLSVLLAFILVAKAFDYRIEAFHLLYSDRGATFGASYTDVHAQLLAYNALFVIAIACAVLVLVSIRVRGLWLPLAGLGFLVLSSLLLNVAYPAMVQRVQVVPNEFEREKKYIAYTIDFTRQGFGLDNIERRELEQVELLTMAAVRDHVPTVENVRLWDYRPLLDTYTMQQALWQYYRFPSVDIDRYYIDGQYRQVMLAPRELDVARLPEKGWQNERVFNTHGCGVVMSPVSDVIESGLPNYVMTDIPPQSTFELDVTEPGIYYGELTTDYIIVGTKEEENDYTLRATNQVKKTRYSGPSGVPIRSPLARFAVAARMKDANIIISTTITKDTRVLWGRHIAQRAHRIAPFLTYDGDPYVVVGDDGGLYWIHDAYTASGMYPYSEPMVVNNRPLNYIRNSVKVVTDAYEGTVAYYVADPGDPIVRAYQKIFPELFRPLAEMPAGLIEHIRYPEALFDAQSERLTVYHMTDPRVFYNKYERWQVAHESPKSVGPTSRVRRSGEGGGERMQAYYAIIRLPGEAEPEFLLMLPFTPERKPNMVAWLAARCDGANYGKLLLYDFPKTEQVWGPMQIEASINQDPDISEKISLWNQSGSSVTQGNLLVIPLDGSLLYVEPIYLRATQEAIPELKRVVVARGDGTVVMRTTLTGALEALLGEPAPELAALEPRRATPAGAAPEAVEEAEVPEEAEAPPEAPPTPAPAAGGRELAEEASRQLDAAIEALRKLQETLGELAETTPAE
jgi:uncharacterized membrane protein (UPF0182 family)